MDNEKQKSIGALWLKESKKGNKFFSGTIELNGKITRIVVFKNEHKKTDKQPDYKIIESIPMNKTATVQKDYETKLSGDVPF